MKNKQYTKCKNTKPVSYFDKRKQCLNGINSVCKVCWNNQVKSCASYRGLLPKKKCNKCLEVKLPDRFPKQGRKCKLCLNKVGEKYRKKWKQQQYDTYCATPFDYLLKMKWHGVANWDKFSRR